VAKAGVVTACLVALGATACSLFVSLDGLSDDLAVCTSCDDAGKSLDGAGVDAALDSGPPVEASAPDSSVPADAGCPSGHGPTMVSTGGFCIDSTEVTGAQYGAFLTAIGGASGALTRTADCAWKTSTSTGCSGGGNFPIACVDWCDANAYCAWAGKRLCGNVSDGGVLESSLAGNRASSEWSLACSPDGRVFPYGNSFEDGVCNTRYIDGGDRAGSVAVGSLSQCVGGPSTLFDMAGNVEEWLDACDSSDAGAGMPTDLCKEGGDAFNFTLTGLARCDNNDGDQRNFTGSDVGIRCCANQ